MAAKTDLSAAPQSEKPASAGFFYGLRISAKWFYLRPMSTYQDVLVALRKITRAIDLHSKQLVRVSGLTAPQLLVLKEVDRLGYAKPSIVAKNVHLSQATVTSIIDRLQRAGLLCRERSQKDRRAVDLTLTEEGREKLQSAPELLQAGFIEKFEKLEDWERTQMVSSIQRLASMMDAGDIDAAPILELGDLKLEDKDDQY